MAIADKPTELQPHSKRGPFGWPLAGRVATHEAVAPPALLLVGAAGQGRGLVRSGHVARHGGG